eukprot:GHVP01057120.1.p1 GENE.GHVP01057120.1~~GHVP01057120.1.p1  ORF type:complete len:152 (+),score=30.00 GHVP01057120.1:27-482(+)
MTSKLQNFGNWFRENWLPENWKSPGGIISKISTQNFIEILSDMSNFLNNMASMINLIRQMNYVHDIKTGEIETENKDTKKAKNDDGWKPTGKPRKTPLVPKNLPPPPPTEQPFKLATPCVSKAASASKEIIRKEYVSRKKIRRKLKCSIPT